MHLSTVSEWLSYIGLIHETEIDLGLPRVKEVAKRLGVLAPNCPVIIVGGTNGKGSTVAGLESIYRAACYRTGVFTSPWLFRYNEQVKIDGIMAEDEDLCEAFSQVEKARSDISLTPFEFSTLAALYLFSRQTLDIWILEVGLGGRLDAVNIMDADVSVITSIGIDHVNWLGDTREKIASEKAGIFRPNQPVVCGDDQPPETLILAAKKIHAPFYQRGKEFDYQENESTWTFINQNIRYDDLPRNMLATENMSVVVKVIGLLQAKIPVSVEAIRQGLSHAELTGRIQIIEGSVTEIYDGSHNPAAILFLKEKLKPGPRTHAVFSMLEDKDIVGSILAIKDRVDFWYAAPLDTKRAASVDMLQNAFEKAGLTDKVVIFLTITEAYRHALQAAQAGDRIIIFGSFHTVSEILRSCRVD